MNVTAGDVRMIQGNDLRVMRYLLCKSTLSQKKAFLFPAKLRAWLHTSYSLIFWGCAGGAETSVTSKIMWIVGLQDTIEEFSKA